MGVSYLGGGAFWQVGVEHICLKEKVIIIVTFLYFADLVMVSLISPPKLLQGEIISGHLAPQERGRMIF